MTHLHVLKLHMLMCAHTHTNTHAETSMYHPYALVTWPFLTSYANILPDELICLASVQGECKNIKPHCTVAKYHQYTGMEWVESHM